jgi:hypothetical protein
MTKDIYSCKTFLHFLHRKLQFTFILYPSALKREHPALKKKILKFSLYLWVIFAILDLDPANQINADPCGSGSTTLFESMTITSKLL